MMKSNINGLRKLISAFIPLFFMFSFLVHAQTEIRVSGTITLEDGTTAPGVTVKLKGASTGTSSDLDGKYQIMAPANGTLVFSQIGSATQEVQVNNRTQINVKFKESVSQLSEVVVVGYGTQKKVNLSGAVSQIRSDELTSKPVPNLAQAMQGVSPGVTITRASGQPGSEGTNIRIRGASSSNTTNALVLVDGIPMDLNLINPDDVESISVLKDASAAAIYGARAAGGVVLVTTKKGSGGTPKINFNSYYGVNITARQPKRLSSWDEQILIDEARFNALGTKEYTAEQYEWQRNPNFQYRENPGSNRWEYYGSTDWAKEGLDKYNAMQNYSLSVGGGDSKLNYLASGSWYQRDGVLRYGPDDNSRTNIRLNVNAELSKYLSVNFIGGYIGSFVNENANGTDNIIANLYRSRNRQVVYTPVEDQTGQRFNGDLQVNAIDIQQNGGLETRDYETFQGKLNLTVKNLVKGLSADFTAWRDQNSYAMEANRRSIFWYGRTTDLVRFSVQDPNEMVMTKNKGYHNNVQGVLNYDVSFNKHNLKLLGGTSYEEYRKDELTASAKGMINNDFFSFNFANPLLPKQVSDNVETWALGSVFGRLNYNFSEKYLFEASFRYDGSSRLAPEKRWQLFPSFSGAWRIAEEDFIKDKLPYVSNLKLRVSWGQLGNGSVLGLYDYLSLINSGLAETNRNNYPNLIFNGEQSQYYFLKELASPTKTWETIQQANLGLDLGLLNEKLTMTADIYEKRNKNMLAQIAVPNIIGIPTSRTNVGELKSWGWELGTTWRDKINSFKYSVGFNISDNQNKLIKYKGRSNINAGRVELLEGYPLNSIWGYKTDGFFQTQAEADDYKSKISYPFAPANGFKPGDVKYLDLNDDKVISAGGATPENPGDLVYLGTFEPRYTYGIDLGLGWKRFDFSLMFQGVAKRAFLISDDALVPFRQSSFMPWTIHMDRWTPENPNAMFPRLYQGNTYNYQTSDRSVQNGAYIRLKNVQLGYTIPVNKKYIQRVRVYFSGQDLWEKTDVLDVFDPEISNNPGSLTSTGAYPFFRTASFGLNVTF